MSDKIYKNIKEREKAYEKRSRLAKALYTRHYKEMHQCEVCGEGRAVCLDFHHKDPSQKCFGLRLAPSKTWTQIKAEIPKCILICANCHRILHAEEKLIEIEQTKMDEEFPLFG